MKENDLKKLFDNASVPEPEELAQARIKKQALEAFRESQLEKKQEDHQNNSQGFDSSPRLTDNTSEINQDERNKTMNIQTFKRKRPLWIGSLAASVAMVIVLINLKNTDTINPSYEKSYENSDEDNYEFSLGVKKEEFSDQEKSISDRDKSLAEKKAQTLTGVISPMVMEESMAVAASPNSIAIQGSVISPVRTARILNKDVRFKRKLDQPSMSFSQRPKEALIENRDRFEIVNESSVKLVKEQPVSTFSIDVDTASYSFVRRQLNSGILPAEDSVRVEEMINYFDYAYPVPESRKQPFATHVNVIDSPWRKGNKLVHIGIKGYEIDNGQGKDNQPDSNLVFLLDVSGSMNSPDKLPLVKQSMGLLLDSLKPTDTVAIVVYAGAAGAVLEPTLVKEKTKILSALNNLSAGGSTAGGAGLALAYSLVEQNFNKEAVNRIILATDGDFNVGITQDERLEDFVARKRKTGIYLSIFGFGQGNYQDALMQKLAQNGNGIAAYIDTLSEAQKILIHEATSSLFPIANDVKIQVEFNPEMVSEYRLIGYETRALKQEDFNNDKVDAGDIGAGHTVTAIYEITPISSNSGLLEDSRYQEQNKKLSKPSLVGQELGFLKLRYKRPGETQSQLISAPITLTEGKQERSREENLLLNEIDFSVSVAGFAQLLRGGKYTTEWNYDEVIKLAQDSKGADEYGYRTEFIQLVRKAKMAKAM